MFIKSQENEYWNMDQVQGLWTNQSGEVRILIANEKRVTLGRYSSKERADRVLADIISFGQTNTAFEMPEE